MTTLQLNVIFNVLTTLSEQKKKNLICFFRSLWDGIEDVQTLEERCGGLYKGGNNVGKTFFINVVTAWSKRHKFPLGTLSQRHHYVVTTLSQHHFVSWERWRGCKCYKSWKWCKMLQMLQMLQNVANVSLVENVTIVVNVAKCCETLQMLQNVANLCRCCKCCKM